MSFPLNRKDKIWKDVPDLKVIDQVHNEILKLCKLYKGTYFYILSVCGFIIMVKRDPSSLRSTKKRSTKV